MFAGLVVPDHRNLRCFLICLSGLCLIAGVSGLPKPHLTATRFTAKSIGFGNGLGGFSGGLNNGAFNGGGVNGGYSAGIGFGLYGGRYNTYGSAFGYNPLVRPPIVYTAVNPLPVHGAVAYQQATSGHNGGLHLAPVTSGFVQPNLPVNGGFVNANHQTQYSHHQSGYYGSSGQLGYNGAGSTFTALQPNYYT